MPLRWLIVFLGYLAHFGRRSELVLAIVLLPLTQRYGLLSRLRCQLASKSHLRLLASPSLHLRVRASLRFILGPVYAIEMRRARKLWLALFEGLRVLLQQRRMPTAVLRVWKLLLSQVKIRLGTGVDEL